MVLMVKNLPANAGDLRDTGSIPGQEDPLEAGMATHSNILAWRVPCTDEPGGLQPVGSQSQTRLKGLGIHACKHSNPSAPSGDTWDPLLAAHRGP